MNLKKPQNSGPKLPQKIDRYQIVGELGKGGMGRVYKAFDPQMDKFLALKVLIIAGKDREKQIQRFSRETQAMAKMKHQNIVQVYNTGQDKEHIFFTMDYIEGTSLKEFLKNTQINPRLFATIMAKIGRAMAYAHSVGIIHRDLKPANIMLDKDKEPYVMDFGLVRFTKGKKSLTREGVVMGTLRYMSPEQARGKKINHLTDVYALGSIFYEMLTAKPLIEGGSPTHMIFNILYKENTPLRQVNKNISMDLEAICHKAITKQREKRYQSAQAFTQDIERFLNGEIIEIRNLSLRQKVGKEIYKNRWAIITAAIGIITVLVGIWAFENKQNLQVYWYIAEAKKIQQKKEHQKLTQMEIYLEASILLEKALEISPHNFAIKKELIKIQKDMGLLAKKKKDFLLSFTLFNRCKKLGDKSAQRLLKQLEQEKKRLPQKHKAFIVKIMNEILQTNQNALLDRYVSTIVKMKRPYVVKILLSYLEENNKLQRQLAIRTLGKLGNKHTKFKGKDSVEWLLNSLTKFQSKKTIQNSEKEIEEIIWALGWLKDKRANIPVYNIRKMAGQNSLLWEKTRVPYSRIPLEKKKQNFVIRGNVKQSKGNLKGAIANYTTAIALNPNDFSAYNNRGNAYRKMGEHSKAIIDYSKVIALRPNLSPGYNNRGNAYKALRQYSKAIADFTKAIALSPNDIAYNNRGVTYQVVREYSKAIADFNKSIVLNSNYARAYNNRGNTYRHLGKYSKAIADYSTAISLNSRYAKAYNNRGNAYKVLRRYSMAIADYSTAIAIDPKYSSAYNNRGNTYDYLKEYSKAIADLTTAITLKPTFSLAYNNRGNTYKSLKKYSKAIVDFNKAIALNPKRALIYNNRANVYVSMKKHSKALTDYAKAITLAPKSSDAYYNRGHLYYKLKEYNKAIVDYNKTIDLYPEYSGYYSRGNTYKILKKYYKAIADFSKAIALNPKFSGAYNNRGNAYRDIKEYSKALADYNKAIILNPKYSPFYASRGGVYLSLKLYQKAYQDFQFFLSLSPNHSMVPQIKSVLYKLRKKNLIK